MSNHAGLDPETRDMILSAIQDFAQKRLSPDLIRELDAAGHGTTDDRPEAILREMYGPQFGIHLFFIDEKYGGMGGGAYDVYRISEAIAEADLGIASAVLATFLGLDPILVGGTEAQKAKWMTEVATKGWLVAYGVTEPTAGSDLAVLRTKADPVEKDGKVIGYTLNGNKQFITNGGIADLYTILAKTPNGFTFFAAEKGTKGLITGKEEDKHGIRISNTAPLTFEDMFLPVENVIGEDGQGMLYAQQVFGYTRLMVATFGLGGGMAALKHAITYARERVQAGSPLIEKQGFTHKLLVPHIVRLEAARAYIEEISYRIDAGETDLGTEGAIAKLIATEAGNAAADAAIQALGGYGYTKEYPVEKIRRDVRITTIYEGTSEIMEWTIARDRWRSHLKTRGQYYVPMASSLDTLHAQSPQVGAGLVALALRALDVLLERARVNRLTRHQHILFRLGEWITLGETAAALCRYAANPAPKVSGLDAQTVQAISRIYAREAAMRITTEGLRWIYGAAPLDEAGFAELERALGLSTINRAQGGLLADMDTVADALRQLEF
ncbi:MAG: acyl-CoA dehydrogenase family protein [Anaerolineae bacterium]|nr:acyl-CoA dehydrogenase family protein [Anaerolineae bacterium]